MSRPAQIRLLTERTTQSNTVKYRQIQTNTQHNTLILFYCWNLRSAALLRFSAVWSFYHLFHLCCQSFALLALKLIWFHFFLQQIFVYRGSNIHHPSIIQLLSADSQTSSSSWRILSCSQVWWDVLSLNRRSLSLVNDWTPPPGPQTPRFISSTNLFTTITRLKLNKMSLWKQQTVMKCLTFVINEKKCNDKLNDGSMN